jgi:hypothetical protein
VKRGCGVRFFRAFWDRVQYPYRLLVSVVTCLRRGHDVEVFVYMTKSTYAGCPYCFGRCRRCWKVTFGQDVVKLMRAERGL